MKTVLQIACLLCVIVIASCKKLGKLKEFDLHYDQEFVIPASNTLFALPFDLNSQDMATNTSVDYKNEGTNSKLVESVYLSELFFDVKSPSSGNFNFLKDVEIYISSPNNSEVLVASKYGVPEDGSSRLYMDVRNINLKGFMQDESYKLRVYAVTDHSITSDMKVTSNETFHVKARLRNYFKK